MPMFNDIGASRKTANKKYLLNYIKVPSVYPLAFINSINSQGKATGVGTSSNFDVYAAMSFSTSTWVLHEFGIFSSRRDLTASPEISQLFGEAWRGAILESRIER